MPKLKTRKAALKRFKITKSGKILRYRAGKKHILEHKSKSSKSDKNFMTEVSHSDLKRIRKMLHM